MELTQLDPRIYAGKQFTARYTTTGYYEISPAAHGFQIRFVPFDAPVEKAFDDVFFGDWLEHPIAFGAFENTQMLGFVEGSMESWNNRFRISNICVFDHTNRCKGIGTILLNLIQNAAASFSPRMLVLETQSCNESAIAFYRKNGFDLIGFDLYSYSNTDPEQHEIRIEMGKKR